jgi:hypothetical protein
MAFHPPSLIEPGVRRPTRRGAFAEAPFAGADASGPHPAERRAVKRKHDHFMDADLKVAGSR